MAKQTPNAGTRAVAIDGLDYAARRFCGEDGNGYCRIDLEDLANGRHIAKVRFDSVKKTM